jgi:hypothetical protein
MIRLVIKGNVGQAYRAASDHRISLNRVEVNNPNEVLARCASDYRSLVVQWFTEGPAQAPFPVGTLLLFTEGFES